MISEGEAVLAQSRLFCAVMLCLEPASDTNYSMDVDRKLLGGAALFGHAGPSLAGRSLKRILADAGPACPSQLALAARSIAPMSLTMKNLLPARFPLLMALYEDNHSKLLRLLPQLRRIEGLWCSDVAGSAPLYCRIVAQEKHTTVALLTHQFEADERSTAQQPVDDPMAYVRVYHDTRQAEVTHLREGAALRELFRADREIQGLANERLRLNLFFGKWLDFIASCGHGEGGFDRIRTSQHDPAPRPLAQRIAELTTSPPSR